MDTKINILFAFVIVETILLTIILLRQSTENVNKYKPGTPDDVINAAARAGYIPTENDIVRTGGRFRYHYNEAKISITVSNNGFVVRKLDGDTMHNIIIDGSMLEEDKKIKVRKELDRYNNIRLK